MLLKLTKFFLYASVLSIGVVLASTFFPFIGGKYYFFRFTVELALAAIFFFWAFEAQKGDLEARIRKVVRSPLFIAVSLFVLAFLLAALFANDPHAGFWSNYERGEGGFQMLHYYLFFTLLLVALNKKEDWMTLFRISILAGLIMVFYGVASAARVDGFVGPYGAFGVNSFWGALLNPQARFQGSLGNPAYVAPYLMFSIFFTLWLWFWGRKKTSGKTDNLIKWLWKKVRQKNPEPLDNKNLLRDAWYLLLALFFLLFFALSETRGAFLGLAAAVFVFLLYLIVFNKKARVAAAAVVVALLLFGGTAYHFRTSPTVQSLPGGRFLTIDLQEQTAQTRFWTWGSAWKGFLERPILGWGPENFTTVFDKYFDARHFSPLGPTETWFDRAHSVIFDYLAETGIVGLLAYLSMFGIFYWLFLKKFILKKKSETAIADTKGAAHKPVEWTGFLAPLLFVMPVAYLVQGLFLFDVLPIYINVFAFLAFASFELQNG